MIRLKQLKKMKKTLLSLVAIFALTFNFYAQVEPGKAVKKAISAHNAYSGNPDLNADKLNEALDMITVAMESDETNTSYKTWKTAGEIFNDISVRDYNNAVLTQTNDLEDPSAVLSSYTAYKNALKFAEKKFETKESIKALQSVANQLNNVGQLLIPAGDYENGYQVLKAMDDVKKIQTDNGVQITLADPKKHQDHKYLTAYCAMQIKKLDEAKSLFAELRELNYDEPRIYAYGYNISNEMDGEGDFSILEDGLKKYPDSQEILFAQINYLINAKKYDVLTDKLKQAIAAAPDNPTVYSALGNVYMSLHQEAFAKGDAKSAEYFDESKSYYEQANAIDPNLFDVQYSLGSLYFNKAAEVTKKMGDLPISEAKKYDMLKAESEGLFNTALPYFKQAEKLNANDINTLIALKEIFARTNDFETSGEFKKRLETVQAGGTNDSSFFK